MMLARFDKRLFIDDSEDEDASEEPLQPLGPRIKG